MNLAHSYPTLHILPKPSRTLNTGMHIVRHLMPQQGIVWRMVAPIFVRNGWEIQIQTDLFIKVSHLQSEQMVIISKIGHGQVLIHHDRQFFGVSELHEIEDLAEIQIPPVDEIVNRPWISRLVMSMIQIIHSPYVKSA